MATKAKKIKAAELELVQEAVSRVNSITTQLGSLEATKYAVLKQLEASEEELTKVRQDLETAYGSVTVDLTTGEYQEVVEEVETVE